MLTAVAWERKNRDKQRGTERDKTKGHTRRVQRGMWDHGDVNVQYNKTKSGKELEERDERQRSFMSADMLRVERRRVQTRLSALSSTKAA